MSHAIRLHYTEAGNGLPVVLLHGFPFDHTIWAAQQSALSDAYRVITPDLRGHGQSPALTADVYSMDDFARDVIALLDTLDIERAVWAGHSMGGYIMLAALRRAPERIAGVALVASNPYPDPPEKQAGRRATAERVLAEGSVIAADGMRPIMFAPGFDLDSESTQTCYAMMANTAPETIAAAQRGMAGRPDSVPTVRDLTVPAVVIAGANDQIMGINVARGMIDILPAGTTLVEIADSGHMPMLEQPAALTVALRAFLDAGNFK